MVKPVGWLILGVFLIASASNVDAQQSIDYASVSGRVTDPSGAVVAGAAVSARHVDTNIAQTTTTDSEGRFRFPSLRVGPYEIRVQQPAFSDETRVLTLSAGSAFELPVTLALSGVAANVTRFGFSGRPYRRRTVVDASLRTRCRGHRVVTHRGPHGFLDSGARRFH